MKIKDKYIANIVDRLIEDIVFYNSVLYPKKKISINEIIEQVKKKMSDA